jgi:hypothetical protein
VHSAGKNLDVMVIAILLQNKLLNYDDAVSKYWPEFGKYGKGSITIADVLRHEGGCPWLLAEGKSGRHDVNDFVVLSHDDLQDVDKVDKAIENTSRIFGPDGSARVYHAHTRGMILDGLLRRVIPYQREKGIDPFPTFNNGGYKEFIDEFILKPLGLTNYHLTVPFEHQEQLDFAVFQYQKTPTKTSTRCLDRCT